MRIKIVRNNLRNVIRDMSPDAVLYLNVSCDQQNACVGPIEKKTGNSFYSITATIPSYSDGTGKGIEEFTTAFREAMMAFEREGCRSIAMMFPYLIPNTEPFMDIYGRVMQSLCDLTEEDDTSIVIYVALDLAARVRLKEALPKLNADEKEYPAKGSDAFQGMALLVANTKPNGEKEEIYIPDDLHNKIRKLNDAPAYYGEDEDAVTAPMLLRKYLKRANKTPTQLYNRLMCFMTRSTVNNYLDESFKKRPNKAPLVYMSLALGLSLEETEEVLEAAGYWFNNNNPISKDCE